MTLKELYRKQKTISIRLDKLDKELEKLTELIKELKEGVKCVLEK